MGAQMNRDQRKDLAEIIGRVILAFAVLGFVVGFLVGKALAGEAPGADLTAPIPMCSEIKLALSNFEGLHSDAFTQYEQMIDDLCTLPNDSHSWAILEAWSDGPDAVTASMPLPLSGALLGACVLFLGCLALVRSRVR